VDNFTVVGSAGRGYGYAIYSKEYCSVYYRDGHTHGWYRRKKDALRRAAELNKCLRKRGLK